MHGFYFTLSSSSSFKSLSQLSRCSIWRSFFLSFLTWRYNSQSFSFSIISTLMVVFIGSLKLSRTYNWSDHGCKVKRPQVKKVRNEKGLQGVSSLEDQFCFCFCRVLASFNFLKFMLIHNKPTSFRWSFNTPSSLCGITNMTLGIPLS